jgi:60 kDa SS-A/Ro ribonucleoprotein
MTVRYSDHVNEKKTAQGDKAKPNQVANNAGGFVFQVDQWAQLDRFLILGNEGGSYYAGEKEMTKKNVTCAEKCIATDGLRTVARVVEISDGGRAPKNEPALLVLAMCAKKGDEATKKAAYEAMPKVARIGTHLFTFAEYIEAFGGWGRATKRAFGDWYQKKPLSAAAFQAVKYQSRNGRSNRDILRQAHPTPKDDGFKTLFKWITKGELEDVAVEGLEIVKAFEAAKKTKDKKEIIKLIKAHGLVREMIPTEFLSDPDVWEAMLPALGVTAVIRNLANMTRIGLLKPMSAATKHVISLLEDTEKLQKGRVHPIAVLGGMLAYKSGGGGLYTKSQNTWTPVGTIVDALDGAFYKTFQNVVPAGKRTLLALDISGSMDGGVIAGVQGLTPRMGSAAMSLITAATEKDHAFIGFTADGGGYGYGGTLRKNKSSGGVTVLDISPKMRLDKVVAEISGLPMGSTDCALPMIWAQKNKIDIDTFCVYTDNETWAGSIHPFQALKEYRQKTGIPAKLAVIGMTATEFSIADPSDAGMMDVVGFDTAAPALLNDFSRG